ncbi:RNase H family protein [Verrucosispora sp. FIM060022]|uniref:ribonuclease HI n=1 Tax=Verrucosispora sp. FIM060022 TaxID=1479020 RepID=UPI000F89C497|nr:RNase H family protein [Verrucosispora sp. FIM060022]RUL95174.1 hypothetical protein EG812_05925 [Verrucosispora sp. FIM060022]
MRPDEFLRAVQLLPADLRESALALQTYVRPTHCAKCELIGDGLRLCLTAARYDEFSSARHLLDTAQQQAVEHGAACRTRPDRRRGRGRVARWASASGAMVAATDASWKDRAGGIGYVVSDGHYGLRGRCSVRMDTTGCSRVLINELRAVDFLLGAHDVPPVGMVVLLDSLAALRYLHQWQAGETTAMPAGYSLRPRQWSDQPTLVRLAQLVQQRPELSFEHVKGHSGHPLNEAADALSHMARRRIGESFDVRRRAHDLVDAFLRDWHATVAH